MFGDLLLNREYLSVFLLSVRPTGGLLDKLRAINVELRRAVLECAWHVLRIRPVYHRMFGPICVPSKPWGKPCRVLMGELKWSSEAICNEIIARPFDAPRDTVLLDVGALLPSYRLDLLVAEVIGLMLGAWSHFRRLLGRPPPRLLRVC